MSSTPHYGYNTSVQANTVLEIDALNIVDRDLKRVEEKADATAVRLAETAAQVAQNTAHMECLGGRINRVDSDIADRYTKSEIDARLECKASKCELEKHLIAPRAHRELFDQKVDKQDGYGLISTADAAQIFTNRDDIAALDSRVTANEIGISQTYTQAEVDALLANKVNVGIPERYALPLTNGFVRVNASEYWKSENGLVTVSFRVGRSGVEIPAGSYPIAYLPEGFRPIGYVPHAAGAGYAGGTRVTSNLISISSDGRILIIQPSTLEANVDTSFCGMISFIV